MSEVVRQTEDAGIVEANRVRKRTVAIAFVTLILVCLMATFVELKPGGFIRQMRPE